MSATLLQPAPVARQRLAPRRRLSRIAFFVHLWLGVISTFALIAIAITGILLNHKRGLGLMPDIPHEPTGAFTSTISLERLASAALEAAPPASRPGWNPGDPVDIALIDRMDVRPRSGLVKVRLRDKASMELTVDINSGRVIHAGRRGDVFLEKLHWKRSAARSSSCPTSRPWRSC
jgi:hypothetical protein